MRRLSLLLPVLAACGDGPTAPSLPDGAVEFSAPAVYQTWWHLTEACSGRSGSMANVSWYVVPGVDLFSLNGQPVSGYWSSSGNRVVLAGTSQDYGPSVRHEMLHALLGAGIKGHPRSEFLGKCGGTVYCGSKCVSDGGSPPAADPTAVLLLPTDFEITVEVVPSQPSSQKDDGHVELVVLARNRSGSAAEAKLPVRPGPEGITFSFMLTRDTGFQSWGGVNVSTPEATRFAAGEVKRYVFDFRISSVTGGSLVAPGAYTFAGAYGGAWASNPPSVTVAP